MGLRRALHERALEIGFDLVGIAPVEAREDLEFARRWVERGYGGEMRYLSNPLRADPRRILPSAKTIICVGLVYNTAYPYSTEVGPQLQPPLTPLLAKEGSPKGEVVAGGRARAGVGPRGWISRYAWGRDYHQVMRAKLERLRAAVEGLAPGVESRLFVDTGPVVERAFARQSGIGWMGKNTCLINQAKGSWFFLGVMLTGLELPPDLPAPDLCGSCTRCLEACPTGALVEPYVMDASRCISYFTIELKGSIPEEFRAPIGVNLFGCDICQDVCPWNAKGRSEEPGVTSQNAVSGLTEFQPMTITAVGACPGAGRDGLHEAVGPPSPEASAGPQAANTRHPEGETLSLFNPPLEALAPLSEKEFRQAFVRSQVKRAKYRGWLRNLCVAMGNSGNARFIPKLQELSQHDDPVVRTHAQWGLGRLRNLA